VLLDDSAVGLDGGVAGDGCPLAGVGDEANVDGLVLLEIVGLARLGVGMEEEVEAICFLLNVSLRSSRGKGTMADLRSQSHGS